MPCLSPSATPQNSRGVHSLTRACALCTLSPFSAALGRGLCGASCIVGIKPIREAWGLSHCSS